MSGYRDASKGCKPMPAIYISGPGLIRLSLLSIKFTMNSPIEFHELAYQLYILLLLVGMEVS
jgi:hypothetical protein